MRTDLTNLSCQEVVDLLEERGYNESSSDIFQVDYISCTDGQVKYKMKFYDIDDNVCEDFVYIFIEKGKIVADY